MIGCDLEKIKSSKELSKELNEESSNDELSKEELSNDDAEDIVSQGGLPFVATDSEWDISREDPWLSTSFHFEGRDLIYLNDKLPDEVKIPLALAAREQKVGAFFVIRDDTTNLLIDAVRRFFIKSDVVRLILFFSAKDLEYALGFDNVLEAIESKNLKQNNNLSGKVSLPGCDVLVKDLCGWSGKKSLLEFGRGLGLSLLAKNSMDVYKSRMFDGMVEKPEEYIRYSTDDAAVCSRIYFAFVSLFRKMQMECLDMSNDDLWNQNDIKTTIGSLVAGTFLRWIGSQADDSFCFEFALRKLGILDMGDRRYKYSHFAFLKANREIRSQDQLKSYLNEDGIPFWLAHYMEAKFYYTGLNSCSVAYFAGKPEYDSSGYNALVQGGRCMNEVPSELRIEEGADVDISGCYGESLTTTIFPIGLPTLWSFSPNQKKITLGDWLDKNRDQLVPGLWTCTLNGQLDFEQDIIQSKLVKPQDIKKASKENQLEDQTDIPSDFVLLRREIKNGILTSHNLEAIEKIATNKEIFSFRKLKVVTACAYFKDDEKQTISEWTDTVIRDRGEFASVRNVIIEGRTKAWVGVPMKNFIGKLVEKRKFYKALSKSAETEDERKEASGMDGTLKLAVNTTYGVLASRFFPVGNTCLANNITARARLGVWMLSKALRTRQSITDGGIYEPSKVAYFKGINPGLETLSKMTQWHQPNRGRWVRNLEGFPTVLWAEIQEGFKTKIEGGKLEEMDKINIKNLDVMVMKHLALFFKPYDLIFPFDIEHKRSFSEAAYLNKADYAFRDYHGKTKFAMRGKDPGVAKLHPNYYLLQNILENIDDCPLEFEYIHKGSIKIKKFVLIRNGEGYKNLRNLRPGDFFTEERIARFNNNHMPMFVEEDFVHRKNRKVINRGIRVQWFEKFAPNGIKFMHQKMISDSLKK